MKFLTLSAACGLAVILVAAALAAEPNQLTPEELDDGWILLFDGETDYGWKAGSKANWKVTGGVISVSSGEMGLLHTTSEFGDFVFKVDFRNPKGTNSGIFLRSPAQPKDPASDCYELNIADETLSPFPTGSFVKREKGQGHHDSSQWRTYTIRAEGGHFTVLLDGKRVLDYVDPKPLGRGFIGLQFNSGSVEFRNVKLKPLGLENIFNGHDLTGWKAFPGKASVFSVTPEGALNVKNGNGQLEFHQSFGDFVLQLEIFSNGTHLNSGIFFRSIPGEFWQGYESQIQNGYKDNDRTQPIDCGTGGFYRRQNARKVVSNDREWFHKTLIVSGDHMATWINGYQVSDWTDTRAPDENPRNGLRLKAGTISIQGHDKTTDLSFRKLRIVELPAR
ncbi:MAG: DUF1080 domain-containing protein [Planctomycetia bacterium]|nr:DUF1080 domain-containing protein [Planctomycetia bacterium]